MRQLIEGDLNGSFPESFSFINLESLDHKAVTKLTFRNSLVPKKFLNTNSNFSNSFSTINCDPDSDAICNAPILEDERIEDEELMDTSVSNNWPKVDFMCFQEVWDRYFTYKLIQSLYPEFKHFVVDVAHHSWFTNMYFGSEYNFRSIFVIFTKAVDKHTENAFQN